MWLRVLCVVGVGEKAACAVHMWRVHVCVLGGGAGRGKKASLLGRGLGLAQLSNVDSSWCCDRCSFA